MYQFVDINERGTESTSLSIQTVFNTTNLDEALTDATGSFVTLTVSGRGNQKNRLNTVQVAGRDGLLEAEEHTSSEREILIKYKLTDETNNGFRKRYNRLNALLQGAKKELSFSDEDAVFYATLSVNEVPEEDSNSLIGILTFLCSDPRKYGPERTTNLNSTTGSIIDVPGTAETEPIFELDVHAPITFAMVSNGEEHMLAGQLSRVDKHPVDTRTLLLEERGATLDTWQTTPIQVDGVVDGNLSTDGDGITVPSYGVDTPDWHGPALIKEVIPAQDFEIVMGLQGRTTEVAQTFRIEFYAFDENMNELGKMATLDNSPHVHTKVGEGRIGNIEDGDYLISSQNYEQRTDFWFGMVRMRRVGNEFELYITRIDNNADHVQSFKETFKDALNQYAGRLKYIQIHIGKYGNTPRAYGPKINYIRAYELARITVDQTPYLAQAGDKIVMNNRKQKIYLNGEPIMKGDFASTPFTLKPGENTLAILPTGAVSGLVRYRPADK